MDKIITHSARAAAEYDENLYVFDNTAVKADYVKARCEYAQKHVTPGVRQVLKAQQDMPREQFDVYYSLAKLAEPNDYCRSITSDNVWGFHKRGGKLFERMLSKVEEYAQKGQFNKIDVYFKPNHKPKTRLLDGFFDFSERNGFPWQKSKSSLKLYFGEGDSLIDVKIPDKDNKIPFNLDIICGPRMIREDKEDMLGALRSLNNFLAYVLLEESIQFEIAVNRLVSITPGFAGYFHVYIHEGVVAFEGLHEIGADDKDPAKHVCYMLSDPDILFEANKFFAEYKKMFTASCGSYKNCSAAINELLCRVTTYDRRKFEEYIISGDYLNWLKSRLESHCVTK